MARILIVDDSPTDQQIAGTMLRKGLNAEIQFADDGVEALKKCDQFAPEIILTDLQMPNLDGLELVAKLKEQFPDIPVILMTAAGSEEIAVKAITAGAASYVSKRKLAQDLCSTVASVLEISGDHRLQYQMLKRQHRWEVELEVENDIQLVAGVVGHLLQGLRGMGVCDASQQVRIGIAIAEAVMNAYYHGNLDVPSTLRKDSSEEFVELAKQRSQQAPYQERRIHVSARFSRGQGIFSIRDEGKGFDTSKVPDPTDASALAKPYGRGLLLMRSFMDEVRFNERGNVVTMVKRW